ncbi:GNAT family N-acetyltransferase [Bacillus carboniphilus]
MPVDKDLYIQLLETHHASELYMLIEKNRLFLQEWLPWVAYTTTPEQVQQFIQLWLEQFSQNNGFNGGIRYHQQLVGVIGMHHIDWQNLKTMIGYLLEERAQGKGIMTKCTSVMLDYIFFEKGLHRVEISCGEHNEKSCAIPERLRFKKEGVSRDGERLMNRFHSLINYSMLRDEWLKLKEFK